MVTATFRFHAELNDFLPAAMRARDCTVPCARAATVKHMIEALGVPHTEVDLILVNGESCGFDRQLTDGDRVAVYPALEAHNLAPLLRGRLVPLRDARGPTRFVADAHLGGLAQLLRLTGYDTLYDNHFGDDEIEAIAARDHRIVLTRDRELLKRASIMHGCYVRALKPQAQLYEIFARLNLRRQARPFSLCLSCNAPLRPLPADQIGTRAPPEVLQRHARFSTCDVCRRVFWEGSHWRRMRTLVDSVLQDGAAGAAR